MQIITKKRWKSWRNETNMGVFSVKKTKQECRKIEQKKKIHNKKG